jgi:GT2 family glycosyltransferase
LREIAGFFSSHPEYGAGMGRVLVPPDVVDPGIRSQALSFRTLPFFDRGEDVIDCDSTFGCNMVVRRAVFDDVGDFDERLGPGAGGFYDDIEIGTRMRRRGIRIGYMPSVVIYHEVDLARLTPAYQREFNTRTARCRFRVEPECASWKNALRAAEAFTMALVHGVAGNEERRLRARGRSIYHSELFRLHLHRGRSE